MLELFFAFLFLLLIAAAFPFLVLFDTYRSVRMAPYAAHAAARGTARSASRKTARSAAQAPAHRSARNTARRTASRAACAVACNTACNVASKREERCANPSAPGDLQRCAEGYCG